jgi:hypothetical protein
MQGRKCFVAALSILILTGCSPNSIMKPDCHSCTVEEQDWSAFSWASLSGQWRGSVETVKNVKGSKRTQKQSAASLRFLTAAQFLEAQGATACGTLPADGLILNGMLWSREKDQAAEYDAFVPVEDNKVGYGRVSFENLNGKRVCHFRQMGPVMGQNRLALPSVSFTEETGKGRALASLGSDTEMNVEFLRFAPDSAKQYAFRKDGRGPASEKALERPPLIIRVYKTTSRSVGERGIWNGSEEQLYRLWKVE